MTTGVESMIAVIRNGDRDQLTKVIADDPALVTAVDAGGMTLLHWAVASEQTALAAELLAHPDIALDTPQASHGRTPLHLAAIKGQKTLISLLLDAGANVFAEDTLGKRPLDVAGTRAAVTALHTPTLFPERALQQAIKSGAIPRISRQLLACPRLLTYADAAGRTPLHWAVDTTRRPIIEALLVAGVPIDIPDRMGCTPLYLAVRMGNLVLTQTLLAAGANPRSADEQGFTPLHIAAGQGDATRPLTLPPPAVLAPAPSANDRETVGQCAFDFATLTTVPAAAAPKHKLSASLSRDDLAIATALIDAGADVNTHARGGVTALHLAAACGDAALVTLLLSRNAFVDPMLALWQATPSHLAAAAGHKQVVTLLGHAGANLATRDNYGRKVTDFHE